LGHRNRTAWTPSRFEKSLGSPFLFDRVKKLRSGRRSRAWWHDDEELADWRAGRNAVYQLAALTIGARLAVADA
jgi:hypothetical protein